MPAASESGGGLLGAHERAFQRSVNALRAVTEGPEPVGLGAAGQGGDGLGGAVDVGEQIEGFRLAPGVAGQQLGRVQGQVIVQRGAGVGEQRVRTPSAWSGRWGRNRCRRRRLRILPPGAAADSSTVTASAAPGQIDRRGQAACSGADHDDCGDSDMRGLHRRVPTWALT